MPGSQSARKSLLTLFRDRRGFTLIEVIVVAAAVIILAALLIPSAFSFISEGKQTKAQSDAGAIAAAMLRFFQDVNQWPGQADILKSGSTARFLIVGDPSTAVFPDMTGISGISAATCTSGRKGVVPNVTKFTAAKPNSGNSLNVSDFLVRKPSATDYPNWRGPYLTVDLSADPWQRAWVINVIPLFCGETITASSTGGNLGYGWILSGGPNRTLSTNFTDARLDPDGDDLGVNLSKLLTPP